MTFFIFGWFVRKLIVSVLLLLFINYEWMNEWMKFTCIPLVVAGIYNKNKTIIYTIQKL